MATSKSRVQTGMTRLLARLSIVFALIAGIAAMHSAIDMPMASLRPTAPVTAEQAELPSSGTELVAHTMPLTSMPTVGTANLSAVEKLMGSMTHDAMHACLFLVIAAALLLLCFPSVGDKLPVSHPRLTLHRRPGTAMRGTDRTLALQVLRI
ncbi:hypothetical protein ACF1AJ_20050 [Leifsonia sp. NPDC014704]|uniref:hypothetical protein n=1 Tax=unclassified Leifsonia TaxID=2663824 RepID=UPI00117AC3A4|nr:hypothetical protein [Leifsonia sp. NCR5]